MIYLNLTTNNRLEFMNINTNEDYLKITELSRVSN